MLLVRISLNISGTNFSPNHFLSQIADEYCVFNIQEPLTFEDDNLSQIGLISLLNPQKIGLEYELQSYENWYINFIEKHCESITNLCIDKIDLFIDVFYTKQCNFEIFNRDSLKKITKYNIAIPISIYNVNDNDIIDLLVDSGYSNEKIQELNVSEN